MKKATIYLFNCAKFLSCKSFYLLKTIDIPSWNLVQHVLLFVTSWWVLVKNSVNDKTLHKLLLLAIPSHRQTEKRFRKIWVNRDTIIPYVRGTRVGKRWHPPLLQRRYFVLSKFVMMRVCRVSSDYFKSKKMGSYTGWQIRWS